MEEPRRRIKMDVVLARVKRIGEREGTNEMRHCRAFGEEENAFSRNACLRRARTAATAPRTFSLYPGMAAALISFASVAGGSDGWAEAQKQKPHSLRRLCGFKAESIGDRLHYSPLLESSQGD